MSTAASSRPFNGLAIAAFVLSFLICWLGIILGFVALSRGRARGDQGAGLARAAIVIGFVEIALIGLFAFALVDSGPKSIQIH